MSSSKVIVVGDAKVGKSVFIKRLKKKEFDEKYNPTMGVETHNVEFEKTNFKLWDCAGDIKYQGLKEGYYIGANAAIVMYDVTSSSSYARAKKYCNEVKKICGDDIPIVICGNKTDEKKKSIKKSKDYEHISISVKNKIKLYEPFMYILTQLKKNTILDDYCECCGKKLDKD